MLRLTTGWAILGLVPYLLAPLVAPAILPLAAVAPLGWYWARTRNLPALKPSAVIAVLALATLYLAVNATWSLSPRDAYASGGVAGRARCHPRRHAAGRCATASLACCARSASGCTWPWRAGGAMLCIEVLSQQWGRRLLAASISGLRPDPAHMVMLDGRITKLEPFLINRSIAVLTLLLWPTALVIARLAQTQRQRLWLLLGLLPAVVAIMRAHHGTSKAALIGGGAVLALYLLAPLATRRLAVAVWVAATLLIVPMAKLAYSHQLYQASWLHPSAQHRIIIWGTTADEIGKAPMLGAGISTARALHSRDNLQALRAPRAEFVRSTALHSHNGFLQAWYEAGAVGALMLFVLGLLILRVLATSPARAQPYLYATFAASMLIGASSFSLWQAWYLATLGLVAIAAALGSAWTKSEPARGVD